MFTLLLLFACAPPVETTLAPETHTWKQEGELVVEGLEAVESLWKAGNRDAARVLAERVYTERWEPRLEEAARRMDGTGAIPEGVPVVEMEYAFSLLLVELEGNGRDLERKVHDLEEKTRAVAEAAGRSFPPPASAGLPAPPTGDAGGSKPLVPDVRPAWESSGPASDG
ncbi:MAG: hypothetical protein Q7U06_00260 [Pseudomonadota bacterium]|nr:hypothetical protein [Pseudomonadota bacterium]